VNLEPAFTSFEILIEVTVNNTTKTQELGWSFIALSHSVGSKFIFNELSDNISIQCKISFRRVIIHDSIINYLRIRYEELLKMQNKCSEKS
jgi:hypothetical protein